MRTLLISFSTQPTMQKYLYYSFSELRDLGVDAWTLGSADLKVDVTLSDQNLVFATTDSPRPSVKSILSLLGQLRRVKRAIRNIDPDIVHFTNKHIWNYALALGARRSRARWVHTFHDPIGHEGDAVRHNVVRYHRLIQRHLDAIIVHSNLARDQTLEVLQPRCTVHISPLGVAKWRESTAHDAWPTGTALVFGRLNSYKGCELYPNIFREVHRLDPTLRVVIAGRPSADLSVELIEEIRSLPNVELVDRYISEDELEALFYGSAVVLTPYTSITQSGVILDAYSRSRSIIGFAIDGMADFVPDSADLIPPFDHRLYARRVVEIAADPRVARERGATAWKFGHARFTPEAMTASTLSLYRELGAL